MVLKADIRALLDRCLVSSSDRYCGKFPPHALYTSNATLKGILSLIFSQCRFLMLTVM